MGNLKRDIMPSGTDRPLHHRHLTRLAHLGAKRRLLRSRGSPHVRTGSADTAPSFHRLPLPRRRPLRSCGVKDMRGTPRPQLAISIHVTMAAPSSRPSSAPPLKSQASSTICSHAGRAPPGRPRDIPGLRAGSAASRPLLGQHRVAHDRCRRVVPPLCTRERVASPRLRLTHRPRGTRGRPRAHLVARWGSYRQRRRPVCRSVPSRRPDQ